MRHILPALALAFAPLSTTVAQEQFPILDQVAPVIANKLFECGMIP